MLQTMEEIKKVEMTPGAIINGVDNANLLSVDSTTPIVTDADIVKDEENKADAGKVPEKKAEDKEVEKKEEVKKAEGELTKPSAESTDQDHDKTKEKEVDDLKDPVEKRIGKLTKKWRTTERERDFEKAKRLEAETELAKLKAQIPATGKPKREDFEDEDTFFEALTDWKIDVNMRSQQEVVAKKAGEETEKQAAEEIEQELEEISERGRDKHEDYNTVVFDKDLVLTQGMVETIIHSDIAEEILYYLGKNPDISAAIGEMTALKAAKEIGRIEARLVEGEKKEEKKEEKKAESPAPAKKLTQTPEPIEPVRSTGATEKDPSQMTPKEYRAWRERNK
jgi:hypothetical protein